MQLMNSTTYELEYFMRDVPPYAILSHTWESEEVTFQHLRDPNIEERRMRGWEKIQGCCSQAVKDGIKWVWIDSCCIDKTSSAELSEAINSMFRWYQESFICYAYLADVASARPGVSSSIKESRWFTRGWTLQELIAPTRVEFYDQDWDEIGTKRSLVDEISKTTFIPIEILHGKKTPYDYLAAERLSWCARRTTTRKEDQAYSLLGLFDIKMPLLYGEGDRAFRRLQQEILKATGDLSILLWSISNFHFDLDLIPVGNLFLARSPYYFRFLQYESPPEAGSMICEESEASWSRVKPLRNKALTISADSVSFIRSRLRIKLPCNIITSLGGSESTDLLFSTHHVLLSEDYSGILGTIGIKAKRCLRSDDGVTRNSYALCLILNDQPETDLEMETHTLQISEPPGIRRGILDDFTRGAYGDNYEYLLVRFLDLSKPTQLCALELDSSFASTAEIKRIDGGFLARLQEDNLSIDYYTAEIKMRIGSPSAPCDATFIISLYIEESQASCSLTNGNEYRTLSSDPTSPNRLLIEKKSDRDVLQVSRYIVRIAMKLKLSGLECQLYVESSEL